MCRLNFNYSPLVSDGELVNASNDAFVGTQYDAKTKIVSNGKTLYLQDENPGLNFERTWLATSSSGGFGGFTKRVVSFSDVSLFRRANKPSGAPPDETFVVSRVMSYASASVSTDAAVCIAVAPDTLYLNMTSYYQSGTSTEHIMNWKDRYGRVTPLRLDAFFDFYNVNETNVKEFLVYDLRTQKVIDILGDLNSFYGSGQEPWPVTGLPG